jgi:hypothetical protein
MLGALGGLLIVSFVLIRDKLFVGGLTIAYFIAAIWQMVGYA